MKKTFHYDIQSDLRSALIEVGIALYRNLIEDTNNWIKIDLFEYDLLADERESICGWVFKLPMELNKEQFLICLPCYFNNEQSFKEAQRDMKDRLKALILDGDLRYDLICYKYEWVFGNKKIPQSIGGNV